MRVLTIPVLLLFATAASAELPSPRLDRITPLGAAAGSSVEVEIVGADLEEADRMLFDHPGIKAEHVKDRKFKVSIAADVPSGTYDARVVGKYGVSSPRLFAVSRDVVEVAEKEPNDEPATAQAVAVNSVVNGTSDQGRDDVFRFPVKKGQRVVIECFAQRLDAQLDGTMTLADKSGKQLASNRGYAGRDPLVDFVAPADGDYFVTLHDLAYVGGHPYRLVITDRPHVENIFPRAVQRGKAATVTVYGRNLGPGAKPSELIVNDLPLEALTVTLTPPDDIWERGRFSFTEHPTGHSVLPTAATCTLTGFQYRGVPMLLTDTPVTLEQEPNNDSAHVQPLTLPAVVSGRFDRERDADWYAIEPTETGPHSFEVYCERIGGRADPYLVVFDDKDTRIAELDDFGIRTLAFDGLTRDASGVVNLTAKKKYKVLVQDRYRRGGPRYQYVLTIRKAVPDFYPAVIHSQNPGPGGTTIRRGGAAYLDVVIHNKEGFTGPVTIVAEDLPKGLHAAPTTINGDNHGVLVLWADADAPDWVGPVKLTATAKRGEEDLVREVRPYTRVSTSTQLSSSRPTRHLVVAIRDSAPFHVAPMMEVLTVEAGKKVELKLQCQRLWPDFKSPVNVTPLAFPGPIKTSTLSIPADQTEATTTIDVQPNARPGEYLLVLQTQAQVAFAKDPKAATKPNTLVTLPSRPIKLVVLPPKK
ncbi:MAG: PPC domain-containing protein [Gemmataceae bacterium]|nr:PPC domain-containing protein [Gemmataceae bacterium]